MVKESANRTSRNAVIAILASLLVLAGCGRTDPSPEPPRVKREPQPAVEVVRLGDADEAERAVRRVIAELTNVNAAAIAMDRPISAPPIKADDLDLVEMVMELEDRLQIQIADEDLDRLGGIGPGPLKITPNQIVELVRRAPKSAPAKKRTAPGQRPK